MISIGDTFVFIGKDITDHHFKNFTFGKEYTVDRITAEFPDSDNFGSVLVILFHQHKWGCQMPLMKKYFVNSNEFQKI